MRDLLIKLVYGDEPSQPILDYIIDKFSKYMDIKDITQSYEKIEEEISKFERWLYDVWGREFYEMLIKDNREEWALVKAFKIAGEKEANILVCDGLSMRELIVLKIMFNDRVHYKVGYAPHPTRTQSAAKKVFSALTLESVFSTGSRLIEGYKWKTEIIKDIGRPPRIGSKKGLAFLTYYPDAPLHHVKEYGIAKVQDVSNVIHSLMNLIKNLSLLRDLIITGDHGYIFLGDNPIKYLWSWRRTYRHGASSYGKHGIEVAGEKMAIGRFHAPDVKRSGAYITHGGVSLTESIVPIITVESEE